MKPNLKVIDTSEGLQDLLISLRDCEYVAYDTETTGLTKYDRVIGFSVCSSESVASYVILEYWNTARTSLESMPYLEQAKEFLIYLKTKKLVCHNAVFDCMITNACLGINLMPHIHTDTMILSHLLDENRRHGLKELASSIFGAHSANEAKEMKDSVHRNGGKLTKTCYEMYKCDPYIMGKYGAQDSLLTYKLFLHLVPKLFQQELDTFFYEDESMPLLRGPTYELNTTGVQVDTTKLMLLKKTLEAECEEAKAFIYKEIHEKIKNKYPGTTKSNTFNIGASSQLAWLLFCQLNLEFDRLTKAGKTLCKELGIKIPYTKHWKRAFIDDISMRVGQALSLDGTVNGKKVRGKKIRAPWFYIAADKNALSKHAKRYKWIEVLLNYQKKQKLLNTYIKGTEERIKYGVLNPSYLQHGTMTGRYASRNPNLQNLPRNDQRVKECFVARPGKVFVSADFSQLEPRIFSYYSKDARLMNAFNGETDFYSVVGMEVYDKFDCEPQKDGENAFGVKYKTLRDLSKVIVLATAYGATPHQLAPTTGKSVDDTADDMSKYLEAFPGVKTMMLEAHELVKNQGVVHNLFGRPRRIPDARNIDKSYGKLSHGELPYDARKLLNMACNFRIQSTGASLVNRAAIAFHKYCQTQGLKCKLISQIHDELVVECLENDAEEVAFILRRSMENTNQLDGVRLEAIPRISRTLAK
jgi:DNA polymerase I-like protein with 3'-5' exonuclease and polymerase domains